MVTLSVSAVGVGSLSYEWKRDGEVIGHERILTIPSFSPKDQGSYTCTVKDKKSQSVTTIPAALEMSKINN